MNQSRPITATDARRIRDEYLAQAHALKGTAARAEREMSNGWAFISDIKNAYYMARCHHAYARAADHL